ncbi:MAG: hypothetical protein ACE366_08460 [Bradymonadia bacterium]
MKRFQSRYWQPLAWMAAATAGLGACDDGGGSSSGGNGLQAQFVTPETNGQAITCADDQNLETQDTIEYNVSLLVRLSGASNEGLQLRLSISEGDAEPVTQPVPASGRVLFGGFPLPVQDGVNLVAELVRDDAVVSTATVSVNTSFDAEDPACVPANPTPTLAFANPADQTVFTAADDLDGTLDNGLQTNITVAAENLPAGTVELTIAGAPAGTAELADGNATFENVALPITGDAETAVALIASAETVEGERVIAEASVTVDVTACAVTLSPEPTEGVCDFDATADADPDIDGVQVNVQASSTCGRVVFMVNGEAQPGIDVVDGTASALITLNEGANTVSAQGSTQSGLAGEAAEITYNVDASAPVINSDQLSPLRENVLAVADGEALPEGGMRVTFTGTVEGLPEGANITAAFEPALPSFRNGDFTVGAEGAFSIPVEVAGYVCGRTLTLTAADDCGNNTSVEYEVCFDSTQPDIRLVSPAGGSVFTTANDARPGDAAEDEGIQVPMAITVVDDRPAEVDYDIYIECRRPNQNYSSRFTLPGDRIRRSDLVDGGANVVATFRGADAGSLGCRATADASPNPAGTQEVPQDYFVVLDTPSFQVTSPNASQCFADGQVFVGGSGQNLAENQAAFTATFTPAGGGDSETLDLIAGGNEAWSIRLGVDEGTDVLPEGDYTVAVAGTIIGGNAVPIDPVEPIAFTVDTTDPEVSLQSPAPGSVLLIGDDDNGDLSDCIQTGFELAVVDPNVAEVCYRLNGAAERCAAVVDGVATTMSETLLDGENTFSMRAQDCAGNETTVETTVTAVCGTPRIQIVDPADGSSLALGADLNPEVEGFQLTANIDSNLPEGARVELIVTEGEQETVLPARAVDADGNVSFPVTVTVPPDAESEYTFNMQGRLDDGTSAGPQITVAIRLVPPSIELPAFGDCVNGQVADASAEPGFQFAVTAITERVDTGQVATLEATCDGGEPISVTGTVDNLGFIDFQPLSLPDEANCTMVASVADAAGQSVNDQAAVQVDRVAPLVGFLKPTPGQTLNDFDDEDLRDVPDAAGIQVTPRVNVCGAAGQTIAFTSNPDALVGDEPLTRVVGAGECSQVSLDRYTMPLGDLSFTATVSDTCGNQTQTPVDFVVDPGAAIVVNAPGDGSTVLVNEDAQPEVEGCQLNLLGQTRGLGADAEFYVCTNFAQGDGPAACDGQSSALNGACAIQGNSAEVFECPLNLGNGTHTLTVVGVFGQRVVSDPITVVADCSAPTVETITIDQDANADACVNRGERTNAASAGDRAQFSVTVAVDGMEDGRAVRVRQAGAEALLGSGTVSNGSVSIPVELDPGQYTLYVTGADEAGNLLPALGTPELVDQAVRINTVVPTPAVVNLAANSCLNAAADGDAEDAFQYALQVTPGGEAGETLDGTLTIDGGNAINAQSGGGLMTFPNFTVADGVYNVEVTVADDCGNAATVNAIPFEVDTQAPEPLIASPADQSSFTADDDANGNAADGFQVAASLDFADRNAIEAGQIIRVFNGEQQITTTPAQLDVPAGLNGAINTTFTLPPGSLDLVARVEDACGNPGASTPVNVQVEIDGCFSQIQGIVGAPAILGPADGNVQGNTLVRTVEGAVDLFDPNCLNADVNLLADGQVIAGPVAVNGGFVSFADVALPAGDSILQLRASLDGNDTLSLGQSILVDIEAPQVSVTSPADGAAVLTDDDAGTPGQQITIVAQVNEATDGSNRTANLEVNGIQTAGPVAVNAANPSNVTFAGVTVPAGAVALRVCVSDAASNEACTTRNVNIDPEAPAAIGDLAAAVTHPRRPTVQLNFTAPGDDGAGGDRVSQYAVRYAAAAIADEGAWDVATDLGTFAATADAGAAESITLDALLPLNGVHQVAVRAMDDVGRMGDLANIEVDVTLNQAVVELTPRNDVAWDNDNFLNTASLLTSVGDVNGDGRGDALVGAVQYDGSFAFEFSQTAIVLGAADPAGISTVELDVATVGAVPVIQYGLQTTGLGDINGDGLDDFAITGVDFAVGFGGTVGVYFGSADPVELATVDSVITVPGRYITWVGAAGNFNQLNADTVAGVTYNDILIGGSSAFDGRAGDEAFVIAGRGAWPATIDATAFDAGNGITRISVTGAQNMGASSSTVGDLNNDGLDDVAVSVGDSPTNWTGVYVFYGANDLPENYAYNVAETTTFALANPCPAAQSSFGSSIVGGADLTGDANGGGDFVVGDRVSRRLSVWDEDQNSTDCFGRGVQNYGAIFDLAGDINADGFVDLVVSHNNYIDNPDLDAWVYFNDGSGMFGTDAVETPRGVDFTLSSPARHKIGVAGLGNFDGDATGYADFGIVYKEPGGTLRVVIFY